MCILDHGSMVLDPPQILDPDIIWTHAKAFGPMPSFRPAPKSYWHTLKFYKLT